MPGTASTGARASTGRGCSATSSGPDTPSSRPGSPARTTPTATTTCWGRRRSSTRPTRPASARRGPASRSSRSASDSSPGPTTRPTSSFKPYCVRPTRRLGSGTRPGLDHVRAVALRRARTRLPLRRSALRWSGTDPRSPSSTPFGEHRILKSPLSTALVLPQLRQRGRAPRRAGLPAALPIHARLPGRIRAGTSSRRGPALTFTSPLSQGQLIYLSGFGPVASDSSVWVKHRGAGAGVFIRLSEPLAEMRLYAAPAAVCPEPFLHLEIPPDESRTWRTDYQFFSDDG